MPALVIAVILYLFPKEVIAKMLVVLLKRLAASTEWTTIDNELVGILEERLKESL